jgi:hypothetical protein
MSWTQYADPSLQAKALKLAKGDYQRSLLCGSEAWSGSTLRGSARTSHGASYYRSRNAVLERLTAAGIPHRFETIDRRKVLIVG